MTTIIVTSTIGTKYEYSFIERAYAEETVERLKEAIDLAAIVVIDGLTGELLEEYRR